MTQHDPQTVAVPHGQLASQTPREGPAPYAVAAFYHFGALPNYRALQAPLRDTCARLGVRGIALLAAEGVNGTMAGTTTPML